MYVPNSFPGNSKSKKQCIYIKSYFAGRMKNQTKHPIERRPNFKQSKRYEYLRGVSNMETSGTDTKVYSIKIHGSIFE